MVIRWFKSAISGAGSPAAMARSRSPRDRPWMRRMVKNAAPLLPNLRHARAAAFSA
jgi:hypothetical protein